MHAFIVDYLEGRRRLVPYLVCNFYVSAITLTNLKGSLSNLSRIPLTHRESSILDRAINLSIVFRRKKKIVNFLCYMHSYHLKVEKFSQEQKLILMHDIKLIGNKHIL